MFTKDRILAAVMVVAAVVGLTLVLTTHDSHDSDDDDHGSTSQVVTPGADNTRPPAGVPARTPSPSDAPDTDDDG